MMVLFVALIKLFIDENGNKSIKFTILKTHLKFFQHNF